MKILIVDDSPDDVTMLRRHLEDVAESIEVCDTGEKALKTLADETFDCIILDQILPKTPVKLSPPFPSSYFD